jgi:hypothetical protein
VRSGILALLIAMVLAPAACFARTQPNPAGQALPGLLPASIAPTADPGRARPVPARAEGTAAVVAVPLPAGAVQIDSTYYDLQDLGSMGPHIATGTDGSVHVTWEDDLCEIAAGGCPPNVSAVQPYPQRGMAYAYRSPAGTWTRLGKVQDPTVWGCCLSEHFGGFGTIDVNPAGHAVVSQAVNEDGCDLRGNFYLENAVGGSTWTEYLTPYPAGTLFPQVADLPNGSYVVMGEVPRVTPTCLHCGNDGIKISRLAAAGTHFTCATGPQCGPWVSVVNMAMFKGGYSGFPSMAAGSDGRVGIAVTDFGGNAWLIESSNGTYSAGTVTIRNLTGYTDAQITLADSTSTQFRPYINCSVAYNDTTPNVVWSEIQARKISGTIYYFDYRSRIRYWNSKEGLSTVKQVQAGEADTYDIVDYGLAGPVASFINTISVDWPQVGFSADGSETYVVWNRFVDSQIDPTAHPADAPDFYTGVGFGDIMASVHRFGSGWSAQQNLTNTPTTDERYPSIPMRGNAPGMIQLLFQASATNQAGVVQAEDRGVQPVNLVRRIAYLEAPLSGSVLAVGDPPREGASATLRILPNPARGRVRFALPPGGAGGIVNVYSVSGALVARVPVAAGGEAVWEGRDRASRLLPSGVYLARVEGTGPASKLLFLR